MNTDYADYGISAGRLDMWYTVSDTQDVAGRRSVSVIDSDHTGRKYGFSCTVSESMCHDAHALEEYLKHVSSRVLLNIGKAENGPAR